MIEFSQDKLHLHFADGNLWLDGPEVSASWQVKTEELHTLYDVARRHTLLVDGDHKRNYTDTKMASGLITVTHDEEFMFQIFSHRVLLSFRIEPKRIQDFVTFLKRELNAR